MFLIRKGEIDGKKYQATLTTDNPAREAPMIGLSENWIGARGGGQEISRANATENQ